MIYQESTMISFKFQENKIFLLELNKKNNTNYSFSETLNPLFNDLLSENYLSDLKIKFKDIQNKLSNKEKAKTYNEKMKEKREKIVKAGIDINKVDNIAKKTAKQLTSLSSSTTTTTKVAKQAVNPFKQMIVELIEVARTAHQLFSDMGSDLSIDNGYEKESQATILLKSLFILLITYLINSIFCTIFTMFFGITVGSILTAVIVAPICEELGKLTSVKEKMSGTYYLVFNVFEFSSYLSRIVLGGGKLTQAVLIRVPALLLHFVNHKIIEAGYKKDKENGLEDSELGNFATFITICIHGAFNALALGTEIVLNAKKA